MSLSTLKKRSKKLVADAFGNRLSFSVSEYFLRRSSGPFVASVTYHDTPAEFAEQFRTHLAWYKEWYTDCDQATLLAFVHSGVWPHEKPGIVLTFDDGLRSNATVAAPILEEFGFTGWFMIPALVPDLDPVDERAFAQDRLIQVVGEKDGQRLFMSWADVRALADRRHEICGHSYGHKRLGEDLTPAELEEEIALPKRRLEEKLERPVDAFAWVGGEEHAFSKTAFDKIRASGYRMLFSTNCQPITAGQTPWCLERYHVDVAYSPNEVRFATSGFYDMLYAPKRRRVAKTLGLL